MKTVVSITPIRVEADSRTFKQAASMARFGYRSIVVEGEPSDIDDATLPFELRSIAFRQPRHDASTHPARASWPRSVRSKARCSLGGLRRRLGSSRLGPPIHFARFLIDYGYRNCYLPLRYIPKASLYYLHAPSQFPAVYLLCKRHRVQFIYDAHDFYSGMKPSGEITDTVERWRVGFIRWVESLCVNQAAAVVTVNNGIAGLQRQAFGCSAITMRNCHDFRLDKQPGRDLRQILNLPDEMFLLLTVGQAKDGQAVQEALTALAALPASVHLAFVGRYYEQHLDLIHRLGLSGRVHLVPPVKPYEVVPFIRSADAALNLYYPRSVNYLNCLPNGFFQSVAAALPLLYPKLPEIKKLAEPLGLGIPIDPRDPESIRSGVQRMMAEEERATYRRNARRAHAELSWEREEGILRDLLQRVLT